MYLVTDQVIEDFERLPVFTLTDQTQIFASLDRARQFAAKGNEISKLGYKIFRLVGLE